MKEHEGVEVQLHSFLIPVADGDEDPPVSSAYKTED
jgi:hypothetical protein